MYWTISKINFLNLFNCKGTYMIDWVGRGRRERGEKEGGQRERGKREVRDSEREVRDRERERGKREARDREREV